jgi:hypothetical protein
MPVKQKLLARMKAPFNDARRRCSFGDWIQEKSLFYPFYLFYRQKKGKSTAGFVLQKGHPSKNYKRRNNLLVDIQNSVV